MFARFILAQSLRNCCANFRGMIPQRILDFVVLRKNSPGGESPITRVRNSGHTSALASLRANAGISSGSSPQLPFADRRVIAERSRSSTIAHPRISVRVQFFFLHTHLLAGHDVRSSLNVRRNRTRFYAETRASSTPRSPAGGRRVRGCIVARRLPAPAHRRIGTRALSSTPGGDTNRDGCGRERERGGCVVPRCAVLRRRFSARPFVCRANTHPSIDRPCCTRGSAPARTRTRRGFLSSRRHFRRRNARSAPSPVALESARSRLHSETRRPFISLSLSLSLPFLSLFSFLSSFPSRFPFFPLRSSFHPRADVSKFAAADALYSRLLLENREEELLLRGESIPRSLWWSKGRIAGTKGRMGKWRKRWRLGGIRREGGKRYPAGGSCDASGRGGLMLRKRNERKGCYAPPASGVARGEGRPRRNDALNVNWCDADKQVLGNDCYRCTRRRISDFREPDSGGDLKNRVTASAILRLKAPVTLLQLHLATNLFSNVEDDKFSSGVRCSSESLVAAACFSFRCLMNR